MIASYPRRDSHHAHRLTRLLFKSCTAQSIGHRSVCLIVHVAHTEDAARYQGPVRFWNIQLMETLGFKSPKQLNSARSKAVDAGWLCYERASDRAVGHYWTTIPTNVDRFDDQPIEPISDSVLYSDSRSENGKDSSIGMDMLSESGTHSGTHCGIRSGMPSNPVPFPNPNTSSTTVDGVGVGRKRKRNSREYSTDFEQWWEAYPRKVGKPSAFCAFAAALMRIRREQLLEQEAALDWLIDRTRSFAVSVANRPHDKIPHGATWLNDDRFNDSPIANRLVDDPYADLEYIRSAGGKR